MDINQTVDDVYKLGRLPLFHAKTGKPFYVPQGQGREQVQLRFEELTALLAALFRYKFGDRCPGGWGQKSQQVNDAQACANFQFDEVVYKHGSERAFFVPKVEIIHEPRRLGNLWARVEADKPIGLPNVDGVDLLHNGQYWCGLEFPECLPMENLAVVRFEFSLLQCNAHAPNPSHGT